MKKNYFMLAAATMMFAACAETELVNENAVEGTPQAIGFETFAGKLTRAENSKSEYTWSLNEHHESFDVWGYKSVSNDYVFTDKVVTYTTSNWGYTGLVYWDKAAESYEFYAAAPSLDIWTLDSNTDAQNDDYFTIKNLYTLPTNNIAKTNHAYVESFKGSNVTDLMIAEPKNVPSSQFGNQVQLNFNHILSRLNITVSKHSSLASQKVTLKSMTIYNVNNQGTFDESATPTPPATLATGTHERWVINENVITYSTLNEEVLVQASTGDAEFMLQSLVMPQLAGVENVKRDGTSTSLQEPYFTIVYTIEDNGNSEEFSASYNLAAAFGISGSNKLAFNEGWQNTLNITINATAITFTGEVAVWDATPKNFTID